MQIRLNMEPLRNESALLSSALLFSHTFNKNVLFAYIVHKILYNVSKYILLVIFLIAIGLSAKQRKGRHLLQINAFPVSF